MKKNILKFTKFTIKLLISFCLLAFLFYYVGFSNIISTFAKVKLFYVFIAYCLFIFSLIVSNLNLFILLNIIGKIKFIVLFKHYIRAWAIGIFSPGRLGELVLVAYLKKYDFKYGETVCIYVIDRAFSFFALMFFTIPAFFLFFNFSYIWFLVLLCFCFFIFLAFIFSSFGRSFIKSILGRYATNFSGFFQTFKIFLHYNKGFLILIFLISMFKVMITGFIIFILFLAFNAQISLFMVIVISAVVMILSLVPISINGLGVKESLAVYLFSFTFVSTEVIFGVYLISMLINYSFALLVFSSFFNSFRFLKKSSIPKIIDSGEGGQPSK